MERRRPAGSSMGGPAGPRHGPRRNPALPGAPKLERPPSDTYRGERRETRAPKEPGLPGLRPSRPATTKGKKERRGKSRRGSEDIYRGERSRRAGSESDRTPTEKGRRGHHHEQSEVHREAHAAQPAPGRRRRDGPPGRDQQRNELAGRAERAGAGRGR